ncbi:MAG TPA: sensor histidine kinase [Chryseolinea sp.]|nr:sensor histidine kinase [Chryseolinea sp.]
MEGAVSQFVLIFSLATVAMLALAGSIILFVVFYQKKMIQEQLKRQQLELDFQQRMMEATMESEENERRRLAGELHDSVGGMLSTIRVGLSTLAKQLPDSKIVDQSKLMLDDTLTSVRRISLDLMPSTLEKFGLVPALRELCERFQATALIPINFEEHGNMREIESKRELKIFRIVQELMNNAIKHAQATAIGVVVSWDDELKITVEDNGIGFDLSQKFSSSTNGSGLGLYNMQNRSRLLNARLDFDAQANKGSKITLAVPYETTEGIHSR